MGLKACHAILDSSDMYAVTRGNMYRRALACCNIVRLSVSACCAGIACTACAAGAFSPRRSGAARAATIHVACTVRTCFPAAAAAQRKYSSDAAASIAA
jgi:hypothetical protein